MTFLLTRKKNILSAASFLFAACFFSSTAISTDENPETQGSCDLENLPIIKESSCADFKDIDGRLNLAYKKLKDKLSKSDGYILKGSQREWIKFRDSKCQSMMDEAEEKCETNSIYCGSRIPANIHDSCILKTTSQRANELAKFLTDLDYAISINYKFSK